MQSSCEACGRPPRITYGKYGKPRAWRYCYACLKKKERLGSPTARRCFACHAIFDDEETAAAVGTHWKCVGCRPKPCEECDRLIIGKRRGTRFCGRACCTRHGNRERARMIAAMTRWGSVDPKPETCFVCDKVFTPHRMGRGKRLYCGDSCKRKAGRVQAKPRACLVCSKVFTPNRYAPLRHRCCSRPCRRRAAITVIGSRENATLLPAADPITRERA